MDSLFIFTAKRSVLAEHLIGEEVRLEIALMEDTSSGREVEKTVVRSSGGAMETLYDRADVVHTIVFEPVNGHKLDEVRELLDSTEGGEEFQAYLYGTEAAPLTLKRTDNGYRLQPFVRVGTQAGDWFQATPITAIEV